MSGYEVAVAAFSSPEWLNEMRSWIGDDLVLDRKAFDYAAFHPTNKLRISEGRQKLLVGHAMKLLDAMDKKDATESEMKNATRYLLICMDCLKYRLDPKAAKKALNIEEYENKYWRKQA